ncbi:hypothetical protein HUG10_00145 [Halorarum halophilum]|uniref:Uncharacterized protein n=1 Tax=Halorarum halophilum TaxID=2743090 RepID=A0A7D5GCN7_9EURY|nr:hypothetical protein [Halobaculum halophilum]QLG26048.1 hypothetical protein HUG10_00145 [Halobaculum halophilum]
MKSTFNEDESGASLAGPVKELFDVLVSTDALLETIDLDELPDVVEVGELPNLVDLDRLSEAVRERNPDLAFDLSHLERVVHVRELWNAVDLLEFERARRRLEEELEDLPGGGALDGVSGDSKAVSDAREFVSSLLPEAKNAVAEQEAQAKSKNVRAAVIEQHAASERLYESNKTRVRSANRQSAVRDPTKVSSLPSGPLPNSVSTRLSTVPSKVPYSKADALPRIYGHRWRKAESDR